MVSSAQWDEFPRCPVCGADIQDDYFNDDDNDYECDCGKMLVITKHSTIKYFVTTKDTLNGGQ